MTILYDFPRTQRMFLLQPGVLGIGLLQDGDVGVGIFPESQEIFVGGESADTGRIGSAPCEFFDCMALARAIPK